MTPIFRRTLLLLGALGLGFGPAEAATLRMTASTPLVSYADPLNLDAGTGIIPSIMDGLTRIGSDGEVVPALAIAWQATSDTAWSFDLRPDVVFSDGTPLDAAAVAASLGVLLGPDGQGAPVATETDGIVAARALDADTVEITTSAKDARLPRKLSRLRIFSADAFRRLGRTAFAKAPVGTGPYRASAWAPGGVGVTLIGVPSSWRAPEQIDRVDVTVVPDRAVRLQSLLAGETDVASNLDPDSIAILENNSLRAHVQPGPIVLAISFRNVGDATPALKDVRVRLALNLAIDRTRISKELLGGALPPATQVATPDAAGWDPTLEPYGHDPDRAKTLLADAGFPNGFQMTIAVFGGQIPGDTLVFQRVAQELAAIGVMAEIRQLPFPDIARRVQSGDWNGFDAFSATWSHYLSGDISRAAERHSCLFSNPWFCVPEMVPLIERSNAEMDTATRAELLRQINRAFHDAVPSLLLVRYASIDGLSRRIERFDTVVDAILFGTMRVQDR